VVELVYTLSSHYSPNFTIVLLSAFFTTKELLKKANPVVFFKAIF
jgi:hypothetical protein